MTLASLASPRCGGFGGGGPSHRLLSTFLSPLICALGASRVPFLQLGVCTGSSTSGISGQDAGDRCSGTVQESGSILLLLFICDTEGNGGLETH